MKYRDHGFDVNFWTAFADLMLALVLVLCLLFFIVMAVTSLGTINLKKVQNEQADMVGVLARNFGANAPIEEDGRIVIPVNRNSRSFDIQIENELDTQKLTFSDQLLFPPDDYRLSPSGKDVLQVVGAAIRTKANVIKEVQIQGHADIRRSSRFSSPTGNTELAALRALEVFKLLQSNEGGGIDPVTTLMSTTSFGEFLPVQRDRNNSQYSSSDLITDNQTQALMDRNRRIEILLIFRR